MHPPGLGCSRFRLDSDLGDAPAIALYTGLGAREDVLHFDTETG